jgi:hypothetical protein
LIPTRKFEPFDYTPPAPRKVKDSITPTDLQDYFVEYMKLVFPVRLPFVASSVTDFVHFAFNSDSTPSDRLTTLGSLSPTATVRLIPTVSSFVSFIQT